MRIVTESPEQTQAVARDLAAMLRPGQVLALHGDLGAGKTCFVQGLAEGLGVSAVVNSPTYTLVHEYAGRIPLFHVDLYRIQAEEEALELGLDEFFDRGGITAIEWPERAGRILSANLVEVRLLPGMHPDQRIITIKGHVS